METKDNMTLEEGRKFMTNIVNAMRKKESAEKELQDYASTLWKILPIGTKVDLNNEGMFHQDTDDGVMMFLYELYKDKDGVYVKAVPDGSENGDLSGTLEYEVQSLSTENYCYIVDMIANMYLNKNAYQTFEKTLEFFKK